MDFSFIFIDLLLAYSNVCNINIKYVKNVQILRSTTSIPFYEENL